MTNTRAIESAVANILSFHNCRCTVKITDMANHSSCIRTYQIMDYRMPERRILDALDIKSSLSSPFASFPTAGYPSTRQYKYPPGPSPKPIIGNVLDVPADKPWITYMKWSRELNSAFLSRSICGCASFHYRRRHYRIEDDEHAHDCAA